MVHIIHLGALNETPTSDAPIPTEILRVLEQFQYVFEEPKTMSPRWACDHRSHWWQTLNQLTWNPTDINQNSRLRLKGKYRSYSMPESLNAVQALSYHLHHWKRKKEGTWCLCIDYRCLNSMTVVSKYPVPVIDELLDELIGVRWFSKLDLSAGFHPIRLAEGKEF